MFCFPRTATYVDERPIIIRSLGQVKEGVNVRALLVLLRAEIIVCVGFDNSLSKFIVPTLLDETINKIHIKVFVKEGVATDETTQYLLPVACDVEHS